MPRLAEIASFYRRLQALVRQQGGEIDPEQEDELQRYADTINAKVDALRVLMVEAEAKAEPYRKEAEELMNVFRAYDREKRNYRRLIVEGMKEAGVKEAGSRIPMCLWRNGGKPKFVWNKIGEPIPEELQRVTIEVDPAKAYQAWKLGFTYDGLEVIRGEHLRDKHNGRKEETPDE